MSVRLILGPMFSGKTTELLRLVRREIQGAGKKCILIKYDKDLRYSSDHVVSHDSVNKMEATSCSDRLSAIFDMLEEYDVIGIDEGQFFTDIVQAVRALVALEKDVIISACDGTFQCKPFGHTLDLVPLCESVVKLTAICMSCKKAAAPYSILNCQKTSDDEGEFNVKIGSSETYSAVCGNCRFRILSLNQMKYNDSAKSPYDS